MCEVGGRCVRLVMVGVWEGVWWMCGRVCVVMGGWVDGWVLNVRGPCGVVLCVLCVLCVWWRVVACVCGVCGVCGGWLDVGSSVGCVRRVAVGCCVFCVEGWAECVGWAGLVCGGCVGRVGFVGCAV